MRVLLLTSFLLTLVGAGLNPIGSFFLKDILDGLVRAKASPEYRDVAFDALMWFGILRVGNHVCWRINDPVAQRLYPGLRAASREPLFKHLVRQAPPFFADTLAGSLGSKVTRIGDSTAILVGNMLYGLTQAGSRLLITFGLMLYTSPFVGGLLAFWFTCFVTVLNRMAKKSIPFSKDMGEKGSALSGVVTDIITNITSVRNFTRWNDEFLYFKTTQQEELDAEDRQKAHFGRFWRLQTLNGLVTESTAVLLASYCLYHDWMTPGTFFLFVFWSLTLSGDCWFLAFVLIQIYEVIGSIEDVVTSINHPLQIVDSDSALSTKIQPRPSVSFRDVRFGYPNQKPIFSELSLTIHAGERVGIVGYSGAGKSTLISLLLRAIEPQSGGIFINDQEYRSFTQEALLSSIAVVPQDPSLFRRSILENIRYGAPSASREEVIVAAKRAHCHDFILALPEGYETNVGERGVKLSGGQRQRLALARAFLLSPAILILDEATSALDSVTERLVQESMKELLQHTTSIVIAHRLSTLHYVDRLLVFDKGVLVQEGNLEVLRESPGIFRELWNTQADGFLPESAALAC